MRASFIIPVKSVNDYILETVSHLQKMQEDNWEAFIVTDTQECAVWQDERIKVLASGRVGPADKRDLAARHASGDIVVFLDDDSYPAPEFLETLRRSFGQGHQAVGGPAVTPPRDSYWQQVSGGMYLSRLTGGTPERYLPTGTGRYVEDWPSVNLSIRRNVFLSVGGFDCRFWPGEDTFLCDKLSSAGVSIWYEPTLIVWHHRRRTLKGHLKQVGGYGLHRGFFARKYGKSSRRLSYFAPSALVIIILLAAIIPFTPVRMALAALLSLYGLTLLLGVISISRFVGLKVAIGTLIYGPLSHIWYGIRFIQGFVFTRTLRSKLR